MWNDGTELYHHGIKGQRWGLRRFQNPDGTLTEAGKERYRKNNYEYLKKNSEKNTPYIRYFYNVSKNPVNSMLSNISKNEEYISAKKNLDNAAKQSRDFMSNEDIRTKYATIAAIARYLSGDMKDWELNEVINFYVSDDGDQGYGNSFQFYLLDKGIDPCLYDKQLNKARDRFNSVLSECIQDELGEFSSMPVPSKYGYYNNAGEYLEDIIDWRKGLYYRYMQSDASPSQIDGLKKELKNAKQYYNKMNA